MSFGVFLWIHWRKFSHCNQFLLSMNCFQGDCYHYNNKMLHTKMNTSNLSNLHNLFLTCTFELTSWIDPYKNMLGVILLNSSLMWKLISVNEHTYWYHDMFGRFTGNSWCGELITIILIMLNNDNVYVTASIPIPVTSVSCLWGYAVNYKIDVGIFLHWEDKSHANTPS